MEVLNIKEHSIENDYTIYWEESLGTGVNGEVRVCTDIFQARYAVKILPDCEESRREVCIQWACKGCEHVVEIVDVYLNASGEENRPYLFVVMELMDRGELWEYLYNNKLSESEAKKLLKQIVKALSYLHSHNIAHRDLKPENILMNSHGMSHTLKLADFGYAEEDNQELSDPLYTFFYAAPEVLINDPLFNKEVQADGPKSYDKKCDLWSLGVIAYIMLMGYAPFFSKGSAEMDTPMYESIVKGDFYYDKSDWNKYSEDASDFVFSLLQVNPEDRPSPKELLQHPWFSPSSSLEELYW